MAAFLSCSAGGGDVPKGGAQAGSPGAGGSAIVSAGGSGGEAGGVIDTDSGSGGAFDPDSHVLPQVASCAIHLPCPHDACLEL